jgi:PEP-CTERM motif-containing protein
LSVRIAWPSLLALCLAAVPAVTQTDVYDNGPTNGTVDAWGINVGAVTSNSFVLASNQTVTELNFAAWLFPYDVLEIAEVSITSSEFGGTTFFDGVVSFTQSDCVENQLGWKVCNETGSFGPLNLNAGTYWLNLQGASAGNEDPVYWDENSGPSMASENSVGTIPSESFTLLGGSSGTTPEPSSIMLFGSGILGLAGILRRKLFW